MNLIHPILSIIFLTMPFSLSSQIIGHIPKQLPSVSVQDYNLAVRILNESFDNIERDNGRLCWADYWNFAYAYTLAQQDPDSVATLLTKSQQSDAALFNELIRRKKETATRWRNYLGAALFNKAITQSSGATPEATQARTAEIKKRNDYTPLELLLIKIRTDDQKYRNTDGPLDPRQKKLDELNMLRIDSLYVKYQTYIGTNLVGDDLQHEMWAVIQHGKLADMLRYLPVIREATACKQLNGEGGLKLLVDRICALKHNAQIFGSQGGVPIAIGRELVQLRNIYLRGIPTSQRRINSADDVKPSATPATTPRKRFNWKF